MGLLFLEGFETFGVNGDTGTALQDRLRTKWDFVNFYTDARLSDVAYDGQGLCLNFPTGSSSVDKILIIGPTPTDEVIVGWAWYTGTSLPTTDRIYVGMGSSSSMVEVTSLANGGFRIYTGEYTETDTGLVVPDTWYYLEFKYKIHASVGYWKLYIDGGLVASGSGDTFVGDTYNSPEISSHKFWGPTANTKIDDIYIYDNTGDVQEPFGPVKVKALFPDGDDTTDWTSTGANHYDQVNDIPVNTATYVESDVASANDLFTFADADDIATSPIYGVQLNLYAAVTDVGVFTLEGVAESNAAQETANETLIDTEGRQYNFVFETDPDTASAWTVSQLNAAIFGVRVG